MIAKIDNTRTPFDIGIGDVIVPEENYLKLQTQLEGYTSPRLMSYSLESTIAEKLEAIFSRMETTSRMKDYYDIFHLSSNYSFDGNILKNAIPQTFINRGTPCDLSFTDVIDAIVRFVIEPIKAIVEDAKLD